MIVNIQDFLFNLLVDIASVDSQLVLLMLLIVVAAIVIDAISHFARTQKQEAGIDKGSSTVSIDGSETLPVRNYISEIQGLAGRPDALIIENGHIIPIERKPLSKKIRDRHVAQLLVYMRLVEEFEGKKPPYGYLIIGRGCRRFKINNTDEKQEWLQKMIDDMQAFLQTDKPVTPDPHPRKCKKCSVNHSCEFKVEKPHNTANPASLVDIGDTGQARKAS